MRALRPSTLFFSMVLAPLVAFGHDLWIEPEGDALVLRYGHRGGALLAIDRAKLKWLRCADGKGSVKDVLAQAAFAPKEVRVTASCTALSGYYHGGFYSLTPDGEKNVPKNEVPDVVKAWESREYAKWVDAKRAATLVQGDALELLPASDLSLARAGDKLTWRVLFEGKPIAGAIVSIGHKPIGETDSAGEVRVKLRGAGLQVLDASYRRKVQTTQADEEVFQASLAFPVAP